MDREEVLRAIHLIEDEIGDWGSISIRLSEDYVAAIRALIEFARENLPTV